MKADKIRTPGEDFGVESATQAIGLSLILVATALATSGATTHRISPKKATAEITSLPEVVTLFARHKLHPDDVDVDSAHRERGDDPEAPDDVGPAPWHVDIYLMVRDGPDMAHGVPWTCFLVNAKTGKIYIRELDLNLTTLTTTHYTYQTLANWRRRMAENPQ